MHPLSVFLFFIFFKTFKRKLYRLDNKCGESAVCTADCVFYLFNYRIGKRMLFVDVGGTLGILNFRIVITPHNTIVI